MFVFHAILIYNPGRILPPPKRERVRKERKEREQREYSNFRLRMKSTFFYQL